MKTIDEKIEALDPKHRNQLIQLAFDNIDSPDEESVKALLDAGLIEAGPDFTGIPFRIHMAVCKWCSNNMNEENP